MAPGLAVWLDVDDLIHIGDLEGYIRSSRMVLVFCTSGYFSSKNCMRELRMAVKLRKAIIPLVETDPLKGGVTILGVYTAHTRIFWCVPVELWMSPESSHLHASIHDS